MKLDLITEFPVNVYNDVEFRLQCCDCKLVHRVVIMARKLETGVPIKLDMKRDNRKTSARRRKKRK